MAIQVKRMQLSYKKRGEVFVMSLPHDALIERAGISPTDGEPSIWYSVNTEDKRTAQRTFVIIMDDEIVDDDNATHTGIWWEGNYAFHLYECTNIEISP